MTPLWASCKLPRRDNGSRCDGNWSGKRLHGPQPFWSGRDELARLCNRVHVVGYRVRCVIAGADDTERARGAYRVPIEFNADAAPSKVFIVVPYASFPRFPRSLGGKKWGIITVALSARAIERSFGVMLQEHDAGTRRCRTRQQP